MHSPRHRESILILNLGAMERHGRLGLLSITLLKEAGMSTPLIGNKRLFQRRVNRRDTRRIELDRHRSREPLAHPDRSNWRFVVKDSTATPLGSGTHARTGAGGGSELGYDVSASGSSATVTTPRVGATGTASVETAGASTSSSPTLANAVDGQRPN